MFPGQSEFYVIFQSLLVALVTMLILAWASIQLAWRIKLIDFPNREPHKLHDRPIPEAGGIALLGTLIICGYIIGTLKDPRIAGTLIAATPIFFLGLWDDFKPISPFFKLIGQVIAALLLIQFGIRIGIFESPGFFLYGSGGIYVALDWFITIIWVVGITNAFNFVDSMDGLLAGLAGVSLSFFLLITLDAGQPILSFQSAILLGACIGLYFYNSSPALLFLGDSGSQLLGFVIAVIAITYNPQGVSQASSWFVPILLLGIPIFDAVLVVISRLHHRRPLSLAARDHTYHRLLGLGIGSTRAVLIMQFAALILGCIAYLCLGQPPQIANLIFGLIILVGFVALVFMQSLDNSNNLKESP